jgi:hypothetical protein
MGMLENPDHDADQTNLVSGIPSLSNYELLLDLIEIAAAVA